MTQAVRTVPDLDRAAAGLARARRVLVTGFAAAPAAAATSVCDLAEAVGAAVDPGDADCARVAGPMIARIGALTAEPAELRDRADLVLFWFCRPERAAAFDLEFATPTTAAGRRRQVLAVGSAIGEHGRVAVPRDAAVDLARILHAAVAGIACPAPPSLAAACDTLRAALEAAGCAAFVTCHDDPIGVEPWSLIGLVRALAHRQPAFEVPLEGGGEAAAVCTWRYGAAGAIARADREGGRFLPAECDTLRLIARGEVDCVVAAGPLPETVENAIAARGDGLTVIRVDAESLAALLAMVPSRAGSGESS